MRDGYENLKVAVIGSPIRIKHLYSNSCVKLTKKAAESKIANKPQMNGSSRFDASTSLNNS